MCQGFARLEFESVACDTVLLRTENHSKTFLNLHEAFGRQGRREGAAAVSAWTKQKSREIRIRAQIKDGNMGKPK